MIGGGYDVVLFDLDGTIYRGAAAIPGAAEAVERVRNAGVATVFVTNNSSRTPEEVAAHLRSVGVPANADDVETSALVTATRLAAMGARTAFVVGERGLLEALALVGISVVGKETRSADAVVVGLDRSIDYAKLRTACLLVERGASLVATNADASFPAADGLWPGAGALLAAVEATTGRTAEVIGKPATPLLEAALQRGGGEHPLIVGDRLDTDIAGAVALGWDSLLVLTGVSTREDLDPGGPTPTFVAEDLGALFPR